MLKSIIYLIISLALAFYGLPRIHLATTDPTNQIFNLAWIFFAMLIIGAHLDHLLVLDEEKRKHLKGLKKQRMVTRENRILEMERMKG